MCFLFFEFALKRGIVKTINTMFLSGYNTNSIIYQVSNKFRFVYV